MLLSNYSHVGIVHLLFSTAVLSSFGHLADSMGKEHFVAFYTTAGGALFCLNFC